VAITCSTCGTNYASDAAFNAAHPGPNLADALKAAKSSGAKILNCKNCPTYTIAKGRPT
jgi:hypothetical protein